MTDLDNSTTDHLAPSGPAPQDEASAGDPELAALVRRDAPADTVAADAAAPGEPADGTPEGAPPVADPAIDAMPELPLAAAVTDDAPPVRPRRRRSFVLRFGAAFALGFLVVVGIGAGALYAWGQQYDGRVLPGVRVGSTELGGLTAEQAQAQIAQAYGWLGAGQITLSGPDDHVTTISYADVGRGPDTSALLDAAFSAGRQGELLENLITAPQVAMRGVTLDPAVAYDRDTLVAAVESLAATIDRTPADASVSAGPGGTFSLSPASDGRAVDGAALVAELDQQLVSMTTPASISMAVPVVPLAPAVSTASAEAAKAAADRMAADVVVTRDEDSWTIARTSLAPLISFSTAADGKITPTFDESGLDPIIEALAKKVDQKVKDAGLKMVDGRIVATGASREGRTLKADGMKAAIVGELGARRAGSATALPVAAVVDAVAPKLSSADAEAFAPKMKIISKYSIFYWVIVNNHWGGNIEAPATKIHGTVVPAGTKFDFWKVVGDVSKLPGVGPGNAIVNGKITVTGALGGGICTTSTTLFNAAFRAGMVPLAKKNHNEYITRYPAGLDATVWIVGKAKQTMSFLNDTKYPIMITRSVTRSGNKRWLTFQIWSVPNGRKAKVSNVVIKHGPRADDIVKKDPTKPVGYRYRNNDPADGAKVWVTVTIYDHGKKHWSKRYYSNYPAVDGLLVVGTKPTT